MKCTTLELLACPCCRDYLDYAGTDEQLIHAGLLICSRCKRDYPIMDGIPHFV